MDCTTVELDDRLAGRAPGRNTATRSFFIIACKVQNNPHPVELEAKASASNDAEKRRRTNGGYGPALDFARESWAELATK